MIVLSQIFDTSYRQVFSGMMRSNYCFKCSCTSELFNGDVTVAVITATSFVLDNNSIVMTMSGVSANDHNRVSLTLNERIETKFVEGRYDAYLLEVVS